MRALRRDPVDIAGPRPLSGVVVGCEGTRGTRTVGFGGCERFVVAHAFGNFCRCLHHHSRGVHRAPIAQMIRSHDFVMAPAPFGRFCAAAQAVR